MPTVPRRAPIIEKIAKPTNSANRSSNARTMLKSPAADLNFGCVHKPERQRGVCRGGNDKIPRSRFGLIYEPANPNLWL